MSVSRLVLLLLLTAALAAQSEPLLVIDPQGHSAIINDIVFTNDGAQLVSASDDKTARPSLDVYG